ncbi:MAG: hypothetical protein KDI49_13775 [Gammaproteobacteria bacterium]|nr:hypothetical protein [Gammaproteobacteria bacterium]MCB1879588.1 hypothetical protein [Gammaproteobacteria bacterium]
MSRKKSNEKKNKPTRVKIVNDSLQLSDTAAPCLITLFEAREITPGGRMLGPLGGLDLTGYGEYRLTLHFAGTPGTAFTIDELFGPAGSVDQVKFNVGSGEIGPKGTLNYRAHFNIFGPRNLFIQINNNGLEPCQVDGTLYAVK